jgi:hypothetical protein
MEYGFWPMAGMLPGGDVKTEDVLCFLILWDWAKASLSKNIYPKLPFQYSADWVNSRIIEISFLLPKSHHGE